MTVGVPRLGIPGIDMSDAAYGVRSSGVNGRYSTALPANVAAAASWDPDAAFEYGALIGRELRAQGFNMTLGGGVNLTREPRNGRTFEYLGEDPMLAGTLVGQPASKAPSPQHVIGDIKHYALNDQESGRNSVNINIGKRAARETDLLAFEIGVEQGHPAAVMCSYNRVNGDFACENKYLLTDVLKKDWQFPASSSLTGAEPTPPRKPPPPASTTKSPAASSTATSTRPPSKPERFQLPSSMSTCTASCAPCLPPASSTIRASAALSTPSPDLKSPARSKKAASFC